MIRLIQSLVDLKKISRACDELADIYGSPLLRHEWIEACAMNFSRSGDLRILLAESGHEITAFAPLVFLKGQGPARLEILGASVFGGGSGLLLGRNESALHELLRGMEAFNLPVYLDGIRTASEAAIRLESFLRKDGLHFYVKRELIPWISFAEYRGNFELLPVGQLKAELESDLASHGGRNEPCSNVHTPGREEVRRILRSITPADGSPNTEAGPEEMKGGERLTGFLENLAELTAGTDILKISSLTERGSIAGIMTGLEFSNRFWFLGIYSNKKRFTGDPDISLTRQAVRYAWEAGLDAVEPVDFSRPWLRLWSGGYHDFSKYRISGSAAGTAFSLSREIFNSITGKLHLNIGRKSRIDVAGY